MKRVEYIKEKRNNGQFFEDVSRGDKIESFRELEGRFFYCNQRGGQEIVYVGEFVYYRF